MSNGISKKAVINNNMNANNTCFTSEIPEAMFFRRDKFITLSCKNTFYMYKYELDFSKTNKDLNK